MIFPILVSLYFENVGSKCVFHLFRKSSAGQIGVCETETNSCGQCEFSSRRIHKQLMHREHAAPAIILAFCLESDDKWLEFSFWWDFHLASRSEVTSVYFSAFLFFVWKAANVFSDGELWPILNSSGNTLQFSIFWDTAFDPICSSCAKNRWNLLNYWPIFSILLCRFPDNDATTAYEEEVRAEGKRAFNNSIIAKGISPWSIQTFKGTIPGAETIIIVTLILLLKSNPFLGFQSYILLLGA